MKVLLMKTSSMGDIIHTFPAITDLKKALPGIEIHWCVEEDFVNIAKLHPAVNLIIPVGLRRWRKNILKKASWEQLKQLKQVLQAQRYDLVVDAQGLLKSAFLAKLSGSPVHGYDRRSIREPLASFFYKRTYPVDRDQHAIVRLRKLFSQVFNYQFDSKVDYGLSNHSPQSKHYIFFHGTTWQTKLWPKENWRELGKLLTAHEYPILLPWSNTEEFERAHYIASGNQLCMVLPKCGLDELVPRISQAKGVVAVDSGLGHLCAAMDVPLVSLYGRTSPKLVGSHGRTVRHIGTGGVNCGQCKRQECREQKSCMQDIEPKDVYEQLSTIIEA